ncbi:Extracellular exo-alpha-(1-_5)-L-arabinofuranosidase ArbA precursor [Posidoniimonas polymericola]|uniref:Extracellular exo-alpha-(1->5)-L-arabinofuranosidase ArbA n=1 Tax=Posidoniimonas polymericola TaxID=2528002 RepID=A0A5C5YSY1_9BACT|nr:family 43 glycosylhydrolase [Posidoniimonas polymericola]TWT77911.1 Extracellular exo-alpha-(1->5)-L-arabinofuranosidase ArbA precursor [Posidoniimonas polymericola]
MPRTHSLLALVLLALACTAAHAQDRSVIVHDPVIAKQGDTYYLFGTGRGITVQSSKDLQSWQNAPAVFREPPAWIKDYVPAFGGDLWAPDIFEHEGTYCLYYSASAFGRNTSAIGVATNTTLDAESPDYQWQDHGVVIRSVPGRDLWNAIDPSVAIDADGTPWMAFGSFWRGLKLVKLTPDLKSVVTGPREEWRTLAARPRDFAVDDRDAGDAANPELDYERLYTPEQLERNRTMQNGAIEAPFLFRKGDHWYLFASWDRCCRGVRSTYKVIVGRADNIRGPYVDRDGKLLSRGGGTLVAAGDGQNWAAAGHPSAYTFDGVDYLVMHAYDLQDRGRPKLRVRPITWQDGWPEIELGE